MKQAKLLTIIMILLALHLLYSNSILLTELVSARQLITRIMVVLFGLSYSLMTVIIISIYPRWYVFTVSAILDGVAVFLKYYPFDNHHTFFVLSAIYFAFYTAFIVVISGMISQRYNTEIDANKQLSTQKNTKDSGNGHVDIDKLLAEKKRLEWGLKRTKNEQAKAEKIKQLEQINLMLKAVQN